MPREVADQGVLGLVPPLWSRGHGPPPSPAVGAIGDPAILGHDEEVDPAVGNEVGDILVLGEHLVD